MTGEDITEREKERRGEVRRKTDNRSVNEWDKAQV